jgi:hypothetical protein
MSKQQDTEEFLTTLKIHNKELDACFNDAVAVAHLTKLFDQQKAEAADQAVREFAKMLKNTLKKNIAYESRDGGIMVSVERAKEQVDSTTYWALKEFLERKDK